MSGIISPFQMERNNVVKFNITQNDNVSSFESISVNLGVDYEISNVSVKDDKYCARLNLLVELEGITNKEEQSFNIHLEMIGIFNCNTTSLDKEKFVEMIKINGVSTLMQLSRAYVTSITALSGFERPIHFPMVNVFELNKLKEESN